MGAAAPCRGIIGSDRSLAFDVFVVLEQESGVLVLLGLGLRLTQRVEADAGDDQDRRTAEGQLRVEVERHDEHGRQQRDEEQVDGTDGVESVDDVLEVARRLVARADARSDAQGLTFF